MLNEQDMIEQDRLDQQELDRLYNEANGITEAPTQDDPSAFDAKKDLDLEAAPSTGSNDDDPLNEILKDDKESEDKKTDDSASQEKEEEKEDDDYVDLENSLKSEDDEEDAIKSDDPIGVQKRIGKEVIRRKLAEEKTAAVQAQIEQMMKIMMGGAMPQPGMTPGANPLTPPPLNFSPPAPAKPYEEMTDFERFNYLAQVKFAEDQARQRTAMLQAQQQNEDAAIMRTKKALEEAVSKDEIIRHIWTTNDHHFTRPMLVALADYPNKASLVRYLHTKKSNELALLKNQDPERQKIGIVKLAERINAEREQAFYKKAQAKKPQPPGKLKQPTLPNTKGSKDIYSAEFLNGLTNDQWDRLVAKGY